MVLLRCTADPQNTVSGLKKRISAVSLFAVCRKRHAQAVLDTVHVTEFGQSNVVSAGAMADTFFVAS